MSGELRPHGIFARNFFVRNKQNKYVIIPYQNVRHKHAKSTKQNCIITKNLRKIVSLQRTYDQQDPYTPNNRMRQALLLRISILDKLRAKF